MPPRLARWTRALAVFVTCAPLIVLDPGGADAQRLFRLGRWEGAAEVGVSGDREKTTVRGGESTSTDRTRYDEQVTIRNSGAYVLDPRVVNSTASLTFGLFQERDHSDSTASSSSGTLLGYSFDTLVFAEKPYSGTIFANRSESVVSREFGGRSDIVFENRGATVTLREDSLLKDHGILHFRSMLGARQEVTDETTSVLGQRFVRNETRTIATYEASKGFETSDLDFRYEFDDVEERRGPLAGFQSHTAALNYTLDFGRDLNKRWESRVTYVARTGLARATLLSADEDLRIDHTETLFSDYRYLFTRNEVETGVTTTQTGLVRAQERFYRNLTTSGLVQGTLQDLPQGQHRSGAAQVDVQYERTLPWRGRAFASAGGRYQVDDNRFSVSRVDVVDESHAAPIPLGGDAGFTLANPFAIAATVVVVDTRGGARLPTTLGIDYVLDRQGDVTRIVPLASSAVILPGDPLVVSYSFEVNPNIEFSTVSWHGTAGVDFNWIALNVAHEQSDQTLLSGRNADLLEDRRVDTARVDLRGEWDVLRAVASAQYRVEDSTRLKFTSEELGQFISYRPYYGLTLSLSGQETFTDFTLPHRRSTSYSARAELVWTGWRGLFVNGFAEYRVSEDSQLPSESVRQVGLRARWTRGKLEVAPDVSWNERARGDVESTDLRFNVRVIRRF
jgi:hypothetical protein